MIVSKVLFILIVTTKTLTFAIIITITIISFKMNRIWKIGSRWSENGDADRTILSVFRRNNIVFVGRDKVSNEMKYIKEKDVVAIANGTTIVSIAIALEGLRTNIKVKDLKLNEREKCF